MVRGFESLPLEFRAGTAGVLLSPARMALIWQGPAT